MVNARQDKQIFKWFIQLNGPWIMDMYNMCCKYGFEEECFKMQKIDFVSLREKVFNSYFSYSHIFQV